MYTLADIATHKNKASCYTVIQDKIYDVTMWFKYHPGGEGAILSICGLDGTDKFMKRHKGGAKFMNVLSHFQIGTFMK